MPPARGKVEGRVALEVGRIDVAAGVDEELGRVELALHGGDVQGRHAARVDPAEDEREAVEVGLEDGDIAVCGGDVEDRVTEDVLVECTKSAHGPRGKRERGRAHARDLGLVDALVEEPADEVESALGCGEVERRLASLRVRVAVPDVAVGRDAVGEADEVLERGRRGATVGERPAEPSRGVDKRQGGCCSGRACEEEEDESEPAPRVMRRWQSRTLPSLSLNSRVLVLVFLQL